MLKLQQEQFTLTTSDKMRVQQAIHSYSDQLLSKEGQEEFKYILAPIIAKNGVDQERFYRIYEAYLKEIRSKKITPVANVEQIRTGTEKNKKWQKVIVTSLVLAGLILLGILARLLFTPEVKTVSFDFEESTNKSEARINDSLHFVNRTLPEDTLNVDFSWEWLDVKTQKVEAQKTKAHHWKLAIPDTESHYEKEVRLIAFNRLKNTADTVRRDFTVICDNPPVLSDNVISFSSSKVRDLISFSITDDPLENVSYNWDFGDGNTSNDFAPLHTYQEEGNYDVNLTLTRLNSKRGKCQIAISLKLKIEDNKSDNPVFSEYPLEIDNSTNPWDYTRLPYFLLFVLLIVTLMTWLKWWTAPDENEKEKQATNARLLQRFQPVDKAPYSIPFQASEDKIQIAGEQFAMANALRHRQEGSRKELDIDKTLQSTIEQGGFPSVAFSYNSRPTDYVFLIDRQTPVSHQSRLFWYLAEMLREQDVHIDIFHYQDNFNKLWSPAFPEGINLDKLHRLFENRRLVVFGDAYALIKDSDATESLNPTWKTQFNKWKEKLLITPTPLISWTYKEARLYRLFPLFTADLSGLMKAAQFIEDGMSEEDLPSTLTDWEAELERSRVDVDTKRRWRTYKHHQEYLQGHPEILRWFKALVVYPQADWNVTLAIGKALGVPVTYDNLLLLARIPWLQQGEFKLKLWRELWGVLPLEDEWAARAAVEVELEAVKVQTQDSFSQQKLEKELAVQKFAQSPNLPENQETIQFLVSAGLLDKQHLEELDLVVERQTTHPANQEKIGDTLKSYLATGTEEKTTRSPFRAPFKWAVILSLLTLLLGIGMLWFAGERMNNFMAAQELAEGESRGYDLFVEKTPEKIAQLLNNKAVEIYQGKATTDDLEIALKRIEGFTSNRRGNRLGGYTQAELFDKNKTVEVGDLLLNDSLHNTRFGLSRAIKIDENYENAALNLAKFNFNQGVREYERLSEGSRNISVEDLTFRKYFTKAAEHDSIRFEALNALGIVYDFFNKKDSACVISDTLLTMESRKIKRSTSSLLDVASCQLDLPIEILYNTGLPPAVLAKIESSLKDINFTDISSKKISDEIYVNVPFSQRKDNLIRYFNSKSAATADFILKKLLEWQKLEQQNEEKMAENFGETRIDFSESEEQGSISKIQIELHYYERLKAEKKTELPLKKNINECRIVTGIDGIIALRNKKLSLKEFQAIQDNSGSKRTEESYILGIPKGQEVILIDIYKDVYKVNYKVLYKDNIGFIAKKYRGKTTLAPCTVSYDTLRQMEQSNPSVIQSPVIQKNERPADYSSLKTALNQVKKECQNCAYCIECQAKQNDKIVNEKQVCNNDIKYLLDYERGFAKAGKEQGRTVNCRFFKSSPALVPAMARIPASTFQMGDTFDEGGKDEKPVHEVSLSAFSMGKYEVTFAEYDLFCEATERVKPRDRIWGRDNRPVINVSWFDAVEYCNWLSEQHGYQGVYNKKGDRYSMDKNANGYRLPMEAEWEFAASYYQGKKSRFGNGKDIANPSELNFSATQKYKEEYSVVGEYREKTIPVGSLKKPNRFGLHDMSGNVYEWCWDWYNDYPSGLEPQGTSSRSDRVYRGGSWRDEPSQLRCTFRNAYSPDFRSGVVGFRLSKSD